MSELKKDKPRRTRRSRWSQEDTGGFCNGTGQPAAETFEYEWKDTERPQSDETASGQQRGRTPHWNSRIRLHLNKKIKLFQIDVNDCRHFVPINIIEDVKIFRNRQQKEELL